jgi:hypothetical protein
VREGLKSEARRVFFFFLVKRALGLAGENGLRN